MKIILSTCARCHKSFDFELYTGLCPHCGCFHRSPGVSMNVGSTDPSEKTKVKLDAGTAEARYEQHLAMDRMLGVGHNDHKASYSDPHERQMSREVEQKVSDVFVDTLGNRDTMFGASVRPAAKASSAAAAEYSALKKGKATAVPNKPRNEKSSPVLIIVRLICIAIIIIGVFITQAGDEITQELIKLFSHDVEVKTESVDGYVDINDGDYYYYAGAAYELCDYIHARSIGVSIPQGTKIVAVDCAMEYDGEEIEYYERQMPYIYDGINYRDAMGYEPSKLVAIEYGIEDNLLDGYTVFYTDQMAAGYMLFVVDEDCEFVTLCCEIRDNGNPKKVYEVNMPLEMPE